MLKKLSEIETSQDSPFKNDALGRRTAVELLTNLIQSSRQPFVLSVEAPWGFGKTTFINLWKSHLESKGHICFYFNAWENDFVDDPLVAFLGEIEKVIEERVKVLNKSDPTRQIWEDVKRIGAGVFRKTLPLAIQIASHGFLSSEIIKHADKAISDEADNIGEFASKLASERLKKYATEKKSIAKFRERLEKFAGKVTEKEHIKPPLLFFVDELDRCRPDFAIALLERVKHLFNVKNVVFVLSIDRSQLNQSVKTLYGIEANTDGYLRRFIDLAYQLPEPTPDAFCSHLFNRFSFDEFNWHVNAIDVFLRSFSIFARAFGLSLRAQEHTFIEMNIAMRTNQEICKYPMTLTFLACLRAAKPGIIEELREGKIEIETVLQRISSIKDERTKIHVEAVLLAAFSEGKNVSEKLRELHQLCASGPIPHDKLDVVRHAQSVVSEIKTLQEIHPDVPKIILSYLSLSTQFR